LRDVEGERSAVGREKDILSHHAFEGFSIDARHDRRLKILPRRPDPFPFVQGPSHGHAPVPQLIRTMHAHAAKPIGIW